MSERIAAFITAYNEETSISSLVGEIAEQMDVYVIDDGSTDQTARFAKDAGARVISHAVKLGQGAAVITMFKLAAQQNYDVIVHLDGDGQHAPQEIPAFLSKMREASVDIVAGSRVLGFDYKGAPLARRLLLRPLTATLNVLTGYRISDSMCGYRAFSRSALGKIACFLNELTETEYLASELWIRFSRAGLTVDEVPVRLRGREYGESRKGHALARYGWGIIRTIVRTILHSYVVVRRTK